MFFVITILFSLSQSNNLFADKSEIPLCYLYPNVFDSKLNSYEKYIIDKCFDTYEDYISGASILDKKEFLQKIKTDQAFERFIFLYVLIKEFLHAQEGTVVDLDFTLNLDDSIFKDYLVWGSQAGNYYATLVSRIESHTESVDVEILESFEKSKYSKLYWMDMGKDSDIENQDAFFKNYSVSDFDEFFTKILYQSAKLEFHKEKLPIDLISETLKLDNNLPEGFYSQAQLDIQKQAALNALYSNNYYLARELISNLYEMLNINPVNLFEIVSLKKINSSYFDVINELCDNASFLFLTDGYYKKDFDFKNELKDIQRIYDKCFSVSEETKYVIEGEGIWWGMVASWYEENEIAHELLLPSKFPKHFGASYAKSNYPIVPSFFNYASLASLKKGNYDQAEEFLFHAHDSYREYEKPNNFQKVFSKLIEIKIIFSKKKYFQSSMLLRDLREEIIAQKNDIGKGYFTDEDIDIFINYFLDLTFELKKIDDDFFVDPIFLFDLKNLVFQSENIEGLRKNSEENVFNSILENLKVLRDEESYIQEKILDSQTSSKDIFLLTEQLKEKEKKISSMRSKLFSLKNNLRTYYGLPSSKYKEVQNQLKDDEVILFYNFAISSGRAVVINKKSIELVSLKAGRNEVMSSVQNIRDSIEIKSASNLNNLIEFDFKSSKELYEKILKSIDLDEINTVLTYSHEILNSIPLQILVKTFDKNAEGWDKYASADWLNKEFDFAIIESLAAEKRNHAFKKKFLGIGDPDLSNNPYFDNLPNTKQELINLALASGGSKNDLFMKDKITLNNFRSLIQSDSERIVIASHAFASNSIPLTNESGIVLTSRNLDTSFITASDIAQLDIKSDWVILSACNTGMINSAYSKNYSSIAKAFLTAGAETVLMSNWNLESNASTIITKSILDTVWLEDEIEKHHALKVATETYRKDISKEYHAHPALWGAFSIVYNSI